MSAWSALSDSRRHRLAIGVALGATDVGPVRESNEDNFLIDAELGLAMVADGMGGHDAGEVASEAALTALREHLRGHAGEAAGDQDGDADATCSDLAMHAVALLHDAIDVANQALYGRNLARQQGDGNGMGTTLCGWWHPPGSAVLVWFNVGDSRLYLLRGERLEQLTRDQTLYQQALEAGMFDNLPARNLLLQAVGPAAAVAPEVRSQLVQPGDVLLLCSDGLHGAVPHGEIERVLAGTSAATLDDDCAQLIALAKQYGGRDNITVLLTCCAG
nr:protein phosphatase 2C domain-containing protein [uncultured Duganella sp.]